MAKNKATRAIDVIAFILLVVGGLNWGLVGFFGFNLVEAIFGTMSPASRIVYALVGLAAIYEIFMWRSIQHRWSCELWPSPRKTAA